MHAAGIVGTCLQLLGAIIAICGFLYAWNRASRRFTEWLNNIKLSLTQLRSKITRTTNKIGAAVMIDVQTSASGTVSHPGPTPERLSRIENTLSELPGKLNEATEAAINEAISEFDADRKAFALKDIYWALGGLGVQVVGYVLSLVSQLCS